MNWTSWLLWGFVSTVVLTSILAGSQGIGMTRMNIPYLLGTIFTPGRDKAKFIGFFLHFVNGWISARNFCSHHGTADATCIASTHGQ
jgi:hypothetical protein